MAESYETLRSRLEARRARREGIPRVAGLVLGLLLGIGLGLYVGWVAWPTEFTDADPAYLDEQYRRDYTLMIAAAYQMDGDLVGARRRLASVAPNDTDTWLLSLTIDHILNGEDDVEIRQLVALATDLGLNAPIMAPYQVEP